MKRFKKGFSLVVCICMLLAVFVSAPAVLAGEDQGPEVGDDTASVDELYSEGGTVYDLDGESNAPAVPEEEPPEMDSDLGDDESDVYDEDSFDAENALQLDGGAYVEDEILITFKDPSQVPGKEKQLQHEIEKFEKIGFVEGLGVYVVKISDLSKNPNAVMNRLKNNKYIEKVEPNHILKPDLVPNDPGYKNQAAVLTAIGAQTGWDIIKGGGPIVAVVDSGVVANPDLPPLLQGYSAVAGLSSGNDKLGHGTGVAGTIGAIGNNNLGGAGINWSASIMPVKVDDAAGTMSVANVAKGIIWAADNGAKIINLSLGTTADNATLRSAIDYAYNKGCAIFAAAGNERTATLCYPARYANVMSVGATDDGKNRAPASNYGPGSGVLAVSTYYTTTASNGFANMTGTSFATPQVVGLASLLWALNPGLSNKQIYDLIQRGASGNGTYLNDQVGYGVINIKKSLDLAGGAAAAQPPAAEPKPEPKPEPAPEPKPEPAPEPKPEPAPVVPPETPQEPPRTPPVITLNGFTDMTLDYGQAYNETGFKATDCKGVDLTSSVKVTNNVNIWTAGLYTVKYDVSDSSGLTASVSRTVKVNAKPPDPPPKQAPKITIIGSNPIILHLNSNTPYKEQMARAIDYDGQDISANVKVTGTVNRNTAGTYKLTYSITGKDGLTATATRDVRILAPTEKRDPRTKYGLSGQAKAGAKVTHTGIVCNELGFIDLKVSSIDKNMTITAQLVDTSTKKAVLTDKFSAAGTKQYKVDKGKYELVVAIDQANGNSKYAIDLLMPEAEPVFIYQTEEVPLAGMPQIAPIGSNPIILHIGGTPYTEQGARAADYLGNDISDQVVIEGAPDTSVAGTYVITYTVMGPRNIPVSVTRDVRILDPNDENTILEPEVPLASGASGTGLNGLLLLAICVVVALFLTFITMRGRLKRQ